MCFLLVTGTESRSTLESVLEWGYVVLVVTIMLKNTLRMSNS